MRIAVVGTGMMGPGIGICLALAGHDVMLAARSRESVDRGLNTAGCGLLALSSEGLVTEADAATARDRVRGATDLAEAAKNADFVFESIVEELEQKRRLFCELEEVASREAIFASNTSGLPISRIADGMQHPERVATAHFWNPPHLMPLVEIIKGEHTSEQTVARLQQLLDGAGKRTVVVQKDVPGQLGNRLLHALFREAFYMLQEGIASVEDIDTAIRYGPGLRFPAYGLLEHADMVGLDMMQAIDSYLFKALSNMDAPPPFLQDLIARGDLGARAGRGLYDWSAKTPASVIARRDKFIIDRLKEARVSRPSDRTA